jgi:hypothetical protein
MRHISPERAIGGKTPGALKINNQTLVKTKKRQALGLVIYVDRRFDFKGVKSSAGAHARIFASFPMISRPAQLVPVSNFEM